MKRVRKYRKGAHPMWIGEVIEAVKAREYMFLRDRPIHWAWVGNMPLMVVSGACRDKAIYPAIITEEWKASQ